MKCLILMGARREDNCIHYDHTKAGAEVKGKRSPCKLGHKCLFHVPEFYFTDREFGDYRIACEDLNGDKP